MGEVFNHSHKFINTNVNILPQAQLFTFSLGVFSFCGTRSLSLQELLLFFVVANL